MSETKAQLQLRCDKLGEALDEARDEIAVLKRGHASASDTDVDSRSALDCMVEDIRYSDLRELVAQLRAALPAIDLERLRKALDEP